MANALYDSARGAFLRGEINWLVDSFSAVLIDTSIYNVNLATDATLDSIAPTAINATGAQPLLTKVVTTVGAADADNVTFTAVSGSQIQAIVIYKDTGASNTSQLVAYIDTATGLPITPNTGDIIVTWDDGTNKIFRL